jgi:hypothetical protein
MKKVFAVLGVLLLCLALAAQSEDEKKKKKTETKSPQKTTQKEAAKSTPKSAPSQRGTQSTPRSGGTKSAPQSQSRPAQGQASVRQGVERHDYKGRVYHPEHYGMSNHMHFVRQSGASYRFYSGYHQYYFGEHWFYAAVWPSWFFDMDTYFLLGQDGFWYCYAYGRPGLYCRVEVGD